LFYRYTGADKYCRGVMMNRFALMLSCVLALSCQASAPPSEPAPDPTELMTADLAFAKATAERGVDGWLEYFAEDGAMLPAGQPIIRGHQAIRDLMSPAFEAEGFELHWEPIEADIAASSDLGYTIGRYERTITAADGNRQTTVGKYVSIWKRQEDGTWKVVVDLGTPDQ
jgi:ketosteroid isomerase-like protein